MGAVIAGVNQPLPLVRFQLLVQKASEICQEVKSLEVWKGAAKSIKAGFNRDLVLTVPKGEAEKIKAELVSQQPLVAPVAQGQRVGTLRVTRRDRLPADFRPFGIVSRHHSPQRQAMRDRRLVAPASQPRQKAHHTQ